MNLKEFEEWKLTIPEQYRNAIKLSEPMPNFTFKDDSDFNYIPSEKCKQIAIRYAIEVLEDCLQEVWLGLLRGEMRRKEELLIILTTKNQINGR